MSDAESQAPIIIRKRRPDDDDDHHGGVWKLAFADFMTAMMAFFLVMWLINSTTKETKAVIVQYFNPVQLVDSSPAHKGLRDPKDAAQGNSVQHTDSSEKLQERPAVKDRETALHQDPIKTLDEIAQREPPPALPPSAQTAGVQPFRDPFDRIEGSGEAASMNPPGNESKGASSSTSADDKRKPDLRASLAGEADRSQASVAALQATMEKIVGQEGRDLRAMPRVEVRQVDEGVLISLTDDVNFTMFAVGSIEPRPQLVRIISQIGKTLAKLVGEIEVHGHTDGRSYSGGNYDNWRLSSDRATMVNYMLTRGGLPPGRIGKVIGFADRRLKAPKDPLAAVNRRIEILLRSDSR